MKAKIPNLLISHEVVMVIYGIGCESSQVYLNYKQFTLIRTVERIIIPQQ